MQTPSPFHLIALARSFRSQYRLSWSLAVVRAMVDAYQEALFILSQRYITCEPHRCANSTGGTNTDYKEWGCTLCNRCVCAIEFAEALYDEFQHTGNAECINKQLELCRLALLTLEASHAIWAKATSALGIALLAQFKQSNEVKVLQEAITLHQHVICLWPKDHPNHHVALLNLGSSLYYLFQKRGEVDDLHTSIDLHRQALSLCVPGHPCRAECLHLLGRSMRMRSNHGGGEQDLHDAVQIFQDALQLRPVGHRDRNETESDLADTYLMLFHGSGKTSCLDMTERLFLEASRGIGYAGRAQAASRLGIVYVLRFELYGRAADLDEGIRRFYDGAKYCPPGHSTHSTLFNNTGVALETRYMLRGNVDDLDEAISMLRNGFRASSKGEFIRDSLSNNLSRCLRARFAILGEDEDIRESTSLIREAVDHRPADATLLLSLTESLRLSFEQMQRIEDLDEALTLHQRWEGQEDTGYETSSLHLHDLATLLHLRYRVTRDVGDLERASELCRLTLASRPPDHPKRYNTLRLHSAILQIISARLNSVVGAEEALALAQEALRTLPAAHTERASCLFHMSRLYLNPDAPYYHLTAALDAFIEAIQDSCCSAQRRLRDGAETLELINASISGSEDAVRAKLLDAYRLTIGLLPHVAYFGLDAETRLRVLVKAEGLAVNGAVHAIARDQPESALVLLEEGRTVFWNQHLKLRSQFDGLPGRLSRPLHELSQQLDAMAIHSQPENTEAADKAILEANATKRRRLGEKFDALVQEARTLPGFQRFMLHEPFSVLARAAEKGPAVVLLANRHSCHAILIDNSTARARALPLLLTSENQLRRLCDMFQMSVKQSRLARRNAPSPAPRSLKISHGKSASAKPATGVRGLLEELWTTVIEPVIHALSLTKADGQARPRVLICSTGLFTHLPVHASGIYNSRSTAFCSNYCIPSLTPTLGHLVRMKPNTRQMQRAELRVLLAGAPRPVKWSALPHASDEVSVVQSVLTSAGVALVAVDQSSSGPFMRATSGDVLRALPQCSILHLACHGYQDPQRPLDSGFVMQDGLVTVSQLLAVNLPNAFMAFLSACETAKGDKNQPDQAIHLAAAMLFTGFKSVIGTMWSMGDVDGPVVSRKVYEKLFGGEGEYLDPDAIPYALDDAVRELRERKVHPMRWATYVHFGI